MPVRFLLLLFLLSCSTNESTVVDRTKEFSEGEVILAGKLLDKIFDKQMASIECIKDSDEAELLIRTLTPRLEIIQDDIEAQLDEPQEIEKLIKKCQNDCTCGYLDEVFKEHQVELSKSQKKTMKDKASEKEMSRCLNYAQTTFCQSELYKSLNEEKKDFSFEENP